MFHKFIFTSISNFFWFAISTKKQPLRHKKAASWHKDNIKHNKVKIINAKEVKFCD